MLKTPRTLLRSVAMAAGLLVGACAPAADRAPADPMGAAVEQFVAGNYAASIAGMRAVLERTDDDALWREACAYMGRAHMALGQTDEAVAAFTLGVQHGDRGPCAEYLELLKQYVEGKPGTLHTRETLTRGELAGALVRMMSTAAAAPGGPTPLEQSAARGWLPPSPDGRVHADEPVTRASLYVVVARLLAEAGSAPRAGELMGATYRGAVAESQYVSGAEALAVLERVRALREQHGR
jgi:hypothetical protein